MCEGYGLRGPCRGLRDGGIWGSCAHGEGLCPSSTSPGHHLLPALPRGLPRTQLLPRVPLSQWWPLRSIHWPVSLRSGLHGGSVSSFGEGGSGRGGGGPGSLGRPLGAVRSAPWAASARTVRRCATAPRAHAASRPTARVCANTASPGSAAPSASAPMASTDSAARSPAPATRSTASGVPQDQAQGSEANGSGLGCRSRGGGPEGGTDVTKGRGRGLGGGGRGALGTRPPPPVRRSPRRPPRGGVEGPGRPGRRARTPSDGAARSRLSCHPMSGECSCLPGWAGLHCNESCPQDTHGPGCQEHCLCLHGGVCQPDSGLCRCAPGYTVRRGEDPGGGGARRRGRAAPLQSPAFRARTAPASAPPTPMAWTATRAAPARTPLPARPSTAPASARRVMGGVSGEG